MRDRPKARLAGAILAGAAAVFFLVSVFIWSRTYEIGLVVAWTLLSFWYFASYRRETRS
jgi:uncharacterized RDD family membrane protein YckC